MIEFDKNQQTAQIKISAIGTSVNLNLDLKNIKSEALLHNSTLDTLTKKQLKGLLEYADAKFKPNLQSPMSWKEQFLTFLVATHEKLKNSPEMLNVLERQNINQEVNKVNAELMKKGGADPKLFAAALTVQYSGFKSMTMDDDYLAVRANGKIISVLPLKGNDYKEVMEYLKQGGKECLSQNNVVDFKSAIRKVKQGQALDKAKNAPQGRGLSMMDLMNKKD